MYPDQFLIGDLGPLPSGRPKTPFAIKYPEFADQSDISIYPITINNSSGLKRKRTKEDFNKIQSAINKASYSKKKLGNSIKNYVGFPSKPYIIQGRVNGFPVLWDQKENTLITKNKEKLEESIVIIRGVPCIFVHYILDSKPKMQKMVLNDYI